MASSNNKNKDKKVAGIKKKDTNIVAVKKPAPKDSAPKKVTIKKAVVKKDTSSTPNTVNKPKVKETLKVSENSLYATGRRKESTAKVWMFKGSGVIRINHLDPLDYLGSSRLVDQLMVPIKALNISGYDIRIDVSGGGLDGQAQASKLGISRAILLISEEFRQGLREEDCLTQDRREKERKKYGKRGARKSPQFRKR